MGEAQDQGIEGMIAVGETIRNRAERRGTIPAIEALRPHQYAFWMRPRDEQAQLLQDEAVYIKAKLAWYASEVSDLTHGATHYENLHDFKRPKWARGMVKTAVIGEHTFWREK